VIVVDDERGWERTISRAPAGRDPDQTADEVRSRARPRPSAARIGRFSILRQLGEGGMGRVYVGYDEELDRKVAIKVLRSDAGDPRRLVREAQSLARLSHPNVVQVHESGTYNGAVFIAMEFVDGRTLADASTDADWRGRLELLVQAGRGLAAAHAAGLVHRDFKPDNVLVGSDGRVRVLDFGLVRRTDGADEELLETEATDPADPRARAAVGLTLRGSVMGTPAYMAPEQHAGQACDAAADQYGFCVAAFELLFELRPFATGMLRELHEAKRSAAIVELPAGSPVPRSVRALILRGLSPSPRERWPSMDALLDALAAELRPRTRSRWAPAVGLLSLALLGFGIERGLASQPDPGVCELDEAALAGIWDQDRRAALHDALARSVARPSAATDATELSTHAAARLDAWAEAWTHARRDSCRATQVEATQSAALLDRREACFARQRAEFDALVEVLTRVDPQLPPRVPEVLNTLPELGACSIAALDATPEQRLDASERAAAEAAYAKLAEARALMLVGRLARTRELVQEAATTAEALGHAALRIESQALLAELELRSGAIEASVEQLRTASFAARRARLVDLEASVRVQLARTVAGKFGRPVLERWMIDEAQELLDVVGRPQDPRAVTLQVARARLVEQAGDYDAAVEAHEQAYALAEGRLDETRRASLRLGVGTSLYRAGRYADARAELERCLAAVHEGWGPWSPTAAHIEFNLAMISSDLGDGEAARVHMDAALELDHRLWGEGSLELARDRFASAYLDFGAGELHRGCAELEPLLPIYERELGPKHDETGQLLTGIGMCRMFAGDDAGALRSYERALAIQQQALGEQHYEVGLLRSNIAEVYLVRGELEPARVDYERARSIFAATLPEDHPLHAYALRGLGTIWLAQGEAERALTALERALELADASDAVELAELRLVLARALVAVHGRAALDRATQLGEDARASFARTGASDRETAAEGWLRRAAGE